VVSGAAEIGIHQMSEIVSEQGVTLVGPLPAAIQTYTTYAVGLAAGARNAQAAEAFIKVLTGPAAAAVLQSRGMEPA
jgi:molybdate transport system substrate-binding protein